MSGRYVNFYAYMFGGQPSMMLYNLFHFWSAPFVSHSPSITRRRSLIIRMAVMPTHTWKGCNVCHTHTQTITHTVPWWATDK